MLSSKLPVQNFVFKADIESLSIFFSFLISSMFNIISFKLVNIFKFLIFFVESSFSSIIARNRINLSSETQKSISSNFSIEKLLALSEVSTNFFLIFCICSYSSSQGQFVCPASLCHIIG